MVSLYYHPSHAPFVPLPLIPFQTPPLAKQEEGYSGHLERLHSQQGVEGFLQGVLLLVYRLAQQNLAFAPAEK